MSPKAKILKQKPRVAFTLVRKEKFLEHYRENGLLCLSGEMVGVTPATVMNHIRKDPVLAERAEDAKQAWIDENLVAAAYERAVKGKEEPVFGGRFKDEIVGYKTKYSDGLLTLLLKSARPAEYREQAEQVAASQNAGVLVVPAAPMTSSEWEAKYREMAQGGTGSDLNE